MEVYIQEFSFHSLIYKELLLPFTRQRLKLDWRGFCIFINVEALEHSLYDPIPGYG